MSILIIDRGKNVGKRFNLESFPIVIGRDNSSQVLVEDEEVSRQHFRIKKRGRLFIVEDLESKNGTYVNGDRVLNSILQSGDRILVGNTELVFVSAESNVIIEQELMPFDAQLGEDIGIQAPIPLKSGHGHSRFNPQRLNPLLALEKSSLQASQIRQVYEFHTNILITSNLDEATNNLLKAVHQMCPEMARSALFIWSKNDRKLVPCGAKFHSKKKGHFLLSQRSFEDVVSRKQGILLQQSRVDITQEGRNRLVLPIIHLGEILCILHMEMDNPTQKFDDAAIEMMQAVLLRVAPIFDTFLLKQELDGWTMSMIETMVSAIEAKDTYTHGHSERVCRYSLAIADELKLKRDLKRLLLMSALCHDIGKIGIPDAILKKASILSAEEYEEMKLHPIIGEGIVSRMPNAHRFMSGIKYHHEKWDGTGYPEGLEGENIPFFGRIVAVADVYDAMISGRAYSGFISEEEAVEKLRKEKDLFDPEMLKAMAKAYENGNLTQRTSTKNNELRDVTGERRAAKSTHSSFKKKNKSA